MNGDSNPDPPDPPPYGADEASLKLCTKLSLEDMGTGSHNVDVEALEGGQGRDAYKSAKLMNAASIRRINQLFRDDFDLFGYDRL